MKSLHIAVAQNSPRPYIAPGTFYCSVGNYPGPSPNSLRRLAASFFLFAFKALSNLHTATILLGTTFEGFAFYYSSEPFSKKLDVNNFAIF